MFKRRGRKWLLSDGFEKKPRIFSPGKCGWFSPRVRPLHNKVLLREGIRYFAVHIYCLVQKLISGRSSFLSLGNSQKVLYVLFPFAPLFVVVWVVVLLMLGLPLLLLLWLLLLLSSFSRIACLSRWWSVRLRSKYTCLMGWRNPCLEEKKWRAAWLLSSVSINNIRTPAFSILLSSLW